MSEVKPIEPGKLKPFKIEDGDLEIWTDGRTLWANHGALCRLRISRLNKINVFELSSVQIKGKMMDITIADMKETDFKNIAYIAIFGELERLEHEGIYTGNGHHLAQRLAGLFWDEWIKWGTL